MEVNKQRPLENAATYSEVRGKFEHSPYSAPIKTQTRWDHFRPESIDKTEWAELLGTDAYAEKHPRLMLGLVREYIRVSPDGSLSQEDQRMLQLAAITNDWGEASDTESGMPALGHISYSKKTYLHRQAEQAMYQTVFQDLLGKQHLKEQLIVESILFNPDTRLGQIYDATRHVNYLRMALSAYKKSKRVDDPTVESHLRWLSADVLSNQLPTLIEYGKTLTPVAQYMESISPQIDTIFTHINEDIFTAHGETERVHTERFRLVRKQWQNSAKSHSSNTDQQPFATSSATPERYLSNDYERLEQIVAAHKVLGKKIVLTSGSFDMIHIGHAKYLEAAARHGDILIVGVDSDTKIKQRKGDDRPIVPEEERTEMLTRINGVDYVVLKQPSDKPWQLIKTVTPDVLIATQETYSGEEITALAEYCKQVIVLPPQATTSTSARIRRLQIGWNNQVVEPIERILQSEELSNEEMRRLLGEFILRVRDS